MADLVASGGNSRVQIRRPQQFWGPAVSALAQSVLGKEKGEKGTKGKDKGKGKGKKGKSRGLEQMPSDRNVRQRLGPDWKDNWYTSIQSNGLWYEYCRSFHLNGSCSFMHGQCAFSHKCPVVKPGGSRCNDNHSAQNCPHKDAGHRRAQ